MDYKHLRSLARAAAEAGKYAEAADYFQKAADAIDETDMSETQKGILKRLSRVQAERCAQWHREDTEV